MTTTVKRNSKRNPRQEKVMQHDGGFRIIRKYVGARQGTARYVYMLQAIAWMQPPMWTSIKRFYYLRNARKACTAMRDTLNTHYPGEPNPCPF